ncbi:helix-turn-helix domain-containing protein [Aeromicrobium alkaliterrae]|uniref:Helix-turn-helix domain-containing protein n=1 Tax=Aeromicrobium alkaliterrae TaxID=302168 RepID=A0ABP4W684_9ACTN
MDDQPGADDGVLDPERPNALGHGFGVIGDEWTLLILRATFDGARKYGEIGAAFPISHAVLTARLDSLVAEDVLRKEVYQRNPVRSEYLLTEKGRGLWPVLTALWRWERTWAPRDQGVTPTMVHATCGQEFVPAFCCSACAEPVVAQDVDSGWGPSGGWRRSVPHVQTRRRSGNRRQQEYFYPDTMAVFGNRWSSAIVGAAFMGLTRFNDFHDKLKVPPTLLAARLTSLCESGILHQVVLPDRPDWSEYKLTPKGLDFFPVIGTTAAWAEHWYHEEAGDVLSWSHRSCGQAFTGVFHCDQCHEVLRGGDLRQGGA